MYKWDCPDTTSGIETNSFQIARAPMRKNQKVFDTRPMLLIMLRIDEIRRRRTRLGLTMAQAAARAGFKTSQQWSNIEIGAVPRPRVDTLAAVAKALDCKLDDLYSLDDEPKSREDLKAERERIVGEEAAVEIARHAFRQEAVEKERAIREQEKESQRNKRTASTRRTPRQR